MWPGPGSATKRLAAVLAAAFCLGAAGLATAQSQDAPPGGAIQLAQAEPAEITFWESVRDSANPEELRAYLEAYPDGHFTSLARLRLKALSDAEKILPQPDPTPPLAESDPGADPRRLAGFAFEHGLTLLEEEGAAAALPFLQMAVARDPEQALYLETLADAFLALRSDGALVLAIEAYQAALELEPSRRDALEGLRVAALLDDRPLIALDATEGLLMHGGELDLNYLPAVTALWILVDEPDRGLERLAEALPESADPASVRLAMAALHQYRGDKAEVTRLAEQVLAETGPESGHAAVARSLLQQEAAQ